MYKISEQILADVLRCLKLSQLNHKSLTYIEKEKNKNKIRDLIEYLEINYQQIKKK